MDQRLDQEMIRPAFRVGPTCKEDQIGGTMCKPNAINHPSITIHGWEVSSQMVDLHIRSLRI